MKHRFSFSAWAKPLPFLAGTLCFTMATVAWLGWSSYTSYRDMDLKHKRIARVEQLRGIIVHLDEVLTMSARMAAATCDLRWERRYRRFEPKLDAAIQEAIQLAPEAYSGKAAEVLKSAVPMIDRCAQKNVIPRKRASRMIARLTKRVTTI